MTVTKHGYGSSLKWKPTILLRGVVEEKLISIIVRCFAKHITDQKGTDRERAGVLNSCRFLWKIKVAIYI